MDRATFESQKAFAGERKASMQRRCVDNDYTARRMYMITMVAEGRRPLFGKVVGRSTQKGQFFLCTLLDSYYLSIIEANTYYFITKQFCPID